MKHAYLQSGRTFQPVDPEALHVCERLPMGTYTINLKMPENIFIIERVDDFTLPPKLYGDVQKKALRVLNTFEERNVATGMLLSGEKGSGKTMLAKKVCQLGQERGIITIVINQPLCGESFNAFVQAIDQPAIVLFDEFEKVYNAETQQKLLTIFDGVYTTKKLFILTCNDKYRIDSHMHNRPGRLFYALDYNTLDAEFVREYCEDVLINKTHIEGVESVAGFFSAFSFDMLKALVEEMNRYAEPAAEAMKMLNMKPYNESGVSFDVMFVRNNKPLFLYGDSQEEFDTGFVVHSTVPKHPLLCDGWRHFLRSPSVNEDEDGDEGYLTEGERKKSQESPAMEYALEVPYSYVHDVAALVRSDPKNGTYTFSTRRPDIFAVFKRKVKRNAAYAYDGVDF